MVLLNVVTGACEYFIFYVVRLCVLCGRTIFRMLSFDDDDDDD